MSDSRKWYPAKLADPIGFVCFSTFLVVVFALFKGVPLLSIARIWQKNLWSLSGFTLHISMTFLFGYAVAQSKIVRCMLTKFTQFVPSRLMVPVFALLVVILSVMSWGVGLVASAMLCREALRVTKIKNVRMLIVASYSGFVAWHGGVTGSIPLSVASKDIVLGGMKLSPMPFSETLFTKWHILVLVLFSIALFVFWLLWSYFGKDDSYEIQNMEAQEEELPVYSGEMSLHMLFASLVFLASLCVMVFFPFEGMATVNAFLMALAFVCYKGWKPLVKILEEGSPNITPILLQFPLYSALAGLVRESGLGVALTDMFLQYATAKTLPLFTFLSAGVLNVFIPSGGGQWVIQGPVALGVAKALGVSYAKTTMALAWGDAWTNLIQPFWMLPVLSICGISLRAVLPYCFKATLFLGIILSLLFYYIA